LPPRDKMASNSRVVSYQDGVDILTQQVLSFSGQTPYIATIRGTPGIGKSHFGREVLAKLWFLKNGTLIKPHDLEREQEKTLDYVLLEIDKIDNGYERIIGRHVRDFCGKIPDYRMVIVPELAPLLTSTLTFQRVLSFFDLIVENKEHPNYR